MKQLLYFTLIILSLSACDSSQFLEVNNDYSSDTLIIKSKCAVFYSPDSLFTIQLKKELGEDEFFQAESDYSNFLTKAANYINTVNLKIIDAKGKNTLRFIYSDKSERIVETENFSDPWGIIFFDEKKYPQKIEPYLIVSEFSRYFN